jgi:hypothetical protein
MYQVYPFIENDFNCPCGGKTDHKSVHWQGLHMASESICTVCGKSYLADFNVNQSTAIRLVLEKGTNKILDSATMQEINAYSWSSDKLTAITTPLTDDIPVQFETINRFNDIVVLNAIDYVYGHALFDLLNLQRLIKHKKPNQGLVVVVQPMMKWLLPKECIDEIWVVSLNFKQACSYYGAVSDKINERLKGYSNVWLAGSKILDTRENIDIEKYTGIKPFDFNKPPLKPRITFIWREDYGRLWIRNIYFHKGLAKAGLGKLLLPFHYLRVRRFLKSVRRRLGDRYHYTIAGFGKSFHFPAVYDDCRVTHFDAETERNLCRTYAESELVVGVHGSGMLLPSAHAGMVVSMMPSKRWGNFAEDILMVENDKRLSFWQRRILPVNMSLTNTADCAASMVKDRKMFSDKFYDVLR